MSGQIHCDSEAPIRYVCSFELSDLFDSCELSDLLDELLRCFFSDGGDEGVKPGGGGGGGGTHSVCGLSNIAAFCSIFATAVTKTTSCCSVAAITASLRAPCPGPMQVPQGPWLRGTDDKVATAQPGLAAVGLTAKQPQKMTAAGFE